MPRKLAVHKIAKVLTYAVPKAVCGKEVRANAVTAIDEEVTCNNCLKEMHKNQREEQ